MITRDSYSDEDVREIVDCRYGAGSVCFCCRHLWQTGHGHEIANGTRVVDGGRAEP